MVSRMLNSPEWINNVLHRTADEQHKRKEKCERIKALIADHLWQFQRDPNNEDGSLVPKPMVVPDDVSDVLGSIGDDLQDWAKTYGWHLRIEAYPYSRDKIRLTPIEGE